VSGRRVQVMRLGRTAYPEALELQRSLHARRRDSVCDDTLLLTEHEPVLTLGRGADERFLRVGPDALTELGIPLVHTERGGDIKHSLADISKAEAGLGYNPKVDFEEGLRRTVEWYRGQ